MSASKSNPTVDLQQIVDVIPQTITVLAPDGTIIYANQAVLDYTGLTIDDVMKSDFRDRVFHPEDVERLRDERQQALARGEPFENEQRTRGKDGTYQWFLIRYKPLRDRRVARSAGTRAEPTLMISNALKPGCDTMSEN
jgi:formate hydrogenlyase transcriptional activator